MKDKILRTIQSKVHIQKTRSLAGTIVNVLEGEEMAADELTALMCYRELKAFLNGIKYVNGSISAEEIVDYFVDTYERAQVIKAIEQIKNENK